MTRKEEKSAVALLQEAAQEVCNHCDRARSNHRGDCPEHLESVYLRPYAQDATTACEPVDDPVDHPAHYTSHPSGVECITITEHMGFNLGNALKYLWRADLKNDAIEDLKKARWYIEREIQLREKSR